MIAAIALLAVAQVPATFRGVWTMTDGTPIVVATKNLAWLDWPTRSIEISNFRKGPQGGLVGIYRSNANFSDSKSYRGVNPPDSLRDDYSDTSSGSFDGVTGGEWGGFPVVYAADSNKGYGRVFWTKAENVPFRIRFEDAYGSKYMDSFVNFAGGWEKIITTGTFVSGSIRMTIKDENVKGFVKLSGTLTNGIETWLLKGSRFLSRGTIQLSDSATGAPKGSGWAVWTPSKAQYADFIGGKWEATDTLRVRFTINKTYPNGYDALLRRQG